MDSWWQGLRSRTPRVRHRLRGERVKGIADLQGQHGIPGPGLLRPAARKAGVSGSSTLSRKG